MPKAAQPAPAKTNNRNTIEPIKLPRLRRNPRVNVEAPESSEVTVFHELGKALTSSLQLDQVLRTIMEKINEVLLNEAYRSESRRVFATLIRLLGDFDLAEEGLHEAFAAALE